MEAPYSYTGNTLFCEGVALADIAEGAGTPCYVYSSRAMLDRYHAYDKAFLDLPHKICYSVKANSNLSLLRLLASAGSGFDIVSAGELFRVLRAGGNPRSVVFSGVGKRADEVEYAIQQNIHSFNCESEAELILIDSLAARHKAQARVAVRVNPGVDAITHPYTSTGLREHKFGIDISEVLGVYERAASLTNLKVEGVSCHIGSQLLDTAPLMDAIGKMLGLVARLRDQGIAIGELDLGGGLGVPYKSTDRSPHIAEFITSLRERVEKSGVTITIEPGRSIVGEAGLLLTRVLYRKQNGSKEFVIVDAAMNDLLRPALYQGHHEIVPLRKSSANSIVADVVGPVCETGDFFARNREIANVLPGDLIGLCTAGAYGFVLSSNYNSRPRPPEILVEGGKWRTVRTRETFEDLVRGE